jgi:hypothetical protein
MRLLGKRPRKRARLPAQAQPDSLRLEYFKALLRLLGTRAPWWDRELRPCPARPWWRRPPGREGMRCTWTPPASGCR